MRVIDFALPADGAGFGLVGAGEHLDQGRLAGAVLTQQAVHLTGAHLEVDAVERADAGELLDDAGHLEQRSGHVDITVLPSRLRWDRLCMTRQTRRIDYLSQAFSGIRSSDSDGDLLIIYMLCLFKVESSDACRSA